MCDNDILACSEDHMYICDSYLEELRIIAPYKLPENASDESIKFFIICFMDSVKDNYTLQNKVVTNFEKVLDHRRR